MNYILENLDLPNYGPAGILGLLFMLMLGGTFGLPFPEDLLVLWGGLLAKRGRVDLLLVLLVCWVAAMIGDTVMYFLGRLFGLSILETRYFARLVNKDKLEKAHDFLERNRFLAIIISRHLFYLRGATFFSCGLLGMRARHFVMADALAAIISVPVVLAIGYYSTGQIFSAIALLDRLKEWSLELGLLALALVGLYLFTKMLRSRAKAITQTS